MGPLVSRRYYDPGNARRGGMDREHSDDLNAVGLDRDVPHQRDYSVVRESGYDSPCEWHPLQVTVETTDPNHRSNDESDEWLD